MATAKAALAIALALLAAAALRLVFRRGELLRAAAWLAGSAMIAITPCIVPLDARPARLGLAMFAIALLVKVYDLFAHASRAKEMSTREYASYLLNWFWLVLDRPPSPVPRARDIRRLFALGPVTAALLLCCEGVFAFDWSPFPFLVEHTIKTVVLVLVIWPLTNCAASVWRLFAGRALDPMFHLASAATPADFWRRWNRPAQQFFQTYVYRYFAFGRRRSIGILATFVVSGLVHEYVFGIAAGSVQGWQLLFFSTHGVATVLTSRIRPQGWLLTPCICLTLLFNILMAAVFLKSLDAIVPFYSARSG